MFDMWSTVTSKLEAHNTTIQTNAQTNNAGQIQSSGSIKGKHIFDFDFFFVFICFRYCMIL